MRHWFLALASVTAHSLLGVTVGPWEFTPSVNGLGELRFRDTVVISRSTFQGYKPKWTGSRFDTQGAAMSVAADGATLVWQKELPGVVRMRLSLQLSETTATWSVEADVHPSGPTEFGLYLPAATVCREDGSVAFRLGTRVTDAGARAFGSKGVRQDLTFELPQLSMTWSCQSSPGAFSLQDWRQRQPNGLRLITVMRAGAEVTRVQASATVTVTEHDLADLEVRRQVLGQRTRWTDPVDVPHAGFEQGADGWAVPANAAVVDDVAHSGRRSVRLTVADPMTEAVYVTRQVPVVGGSAYAARCFVKTAGVTPQPGRMSSVGAGLIVEWADTQGKWFAAGEYDTKLYGDHDWTRRACETLRAPEEAGYAVIFLALRGAGTAWFDDVELDRVHETLFLEQPVPGVELADNTPTFRWRDDPRASEFVLELSRSREFADARTWTVSDHVVDLPEPLEPGTWYWRVTAPGYEPTPPWWFRQTSPRDHDTTAPVVRTSACRVTAPGEGVEIQIDEARSATLSVRAMLGADKLAAEAVQSAPGHFTASLRAPAGWSAGLNRVELDVSDDAGNRGEAVVSVVCREAPANAVRIEPDGAYSSAGKRIFPFGIYQVSPAAMPAVKAGGFDVVHIYQWEGSQDDAAARAYLDAAWSNGLRVFIGFDRGKGSGNGLVQGNTEHIIRRVAALCGHPGLFCWYLFDEPEVVHQYVSPRALVRYADLIRALDPFHPVVVTTWGKRMNLYRRSWDTHWTQAYFTPPRVVAQIRSHRELLQNASPITLLVHCYDREQSAALKGGGVMDKDSFQPDAAWLRAAAYGGVTQGINGLWWWWYADTAKDWVTAFDVDWAWDALVRVVRELQQLEPVLASPGQGRSATLLFGDATIETWSKTLDGVTTLIAVNTSETPAEAELPLDGNGVVEVLFEERRVERADGVLTDRFDRYGVHVYRFGR